MKTLSLKNPRTGGLLGLMFLLALAFGPAPALAGPAAVLYEVTEDMYLKDAAGKFVTSPVLGGRRMAVARLSGFAQVGTPLCPTWVLYVAPTAKKCTVNASGADDLDLATGKGTLSGTYAVVVQGDNQVDAPEFVVMTGTFKGDANLAPAFANLAPLGYITNGVATVDGYDELIFGFSGTFRLPFTLDWTGKHGKVKRNRGAYYLSDSGTPFRVRQNEKSLGLPTVRIDLKFDQVAGPGVDDEDDQNN
jgi:hypothetical protein